MVMSYKSINEALNKRLKKQASEKIDYTDDSIEYYLADLEVICKFYDYNLIITDYEICVYPIKDGSIGISKPYIKYLIDSFCMNEPKEALKIGIDYVCKEILWLKM